MASKLIGIVGATGTGKSTAIKHLNPEETYIINVAKKELPFKGSEKLYNAEKRNYKDVDDATEITRLLKTISEKAPHIKNIVIEDSNYIMGFNIVSKADQVGFTKFSLMAKDMVELMREARKLRDDIKVFYLSHPETIEDGGEIVGYKIKTAGKMIYNFVTNRFKKLPAKSPDGMFDELKIPNNLQYVCDKLDEYYN